MRIGEAAQDSHGQLRVSVVISAYTQDRWADLLGAISSVAAQTAPALETIVVVDDNPDLFRRARTELALHPGVHVLENAADAGLSGARNTGVAAARGDVIAFLDDDAAAEQDWLERLTLHYSDPDVMGVGGSIEPVWSGDRPPSFPPEFDWVVGCTYRGHPETTTAVRNLIGANMSFRRSLFHSVGGFRSDIGRRQNRPLGCEETEFCLRASATSGRLVCVYEPRARVLHSVAPYRETWRYFVSRCYGEGLSKAMVRQVAGFSRGLQSERTYLLRTIPGAFAGNLVAATRDRDFAALSRAGRIAAGVAASVAGYVVGRTGSRYEELHSGKKRQRPAVVREVDAERDESAVGPL